VEGFCGHLKNIRRSRKGKINPINYDKKETLKNGKEEKKKGGLGGKERGGKTEHLHKVLYFNVNYRKNSRRG